MIYMSWENHPRLEFVRHVLSRKYLTLLLPFVLPMMPLLVPQYVDTAFDAPIKSLYPRSDAPSVKIAMRTTSSENGGLTPEQSAVMKNVFDLLPAAHLASVKFVGVVTGVEI